MCDVREGDAYAFGVTVYGMLLCVYNVQEGDAYAFGVMIYELYSGQPAWAGLSTGDIIAAKLRSHASVALRMTEDCPPTLQVIATAIAHHLF